MNERKQTEQTCTIRRIGLVLPDGYHSFFPLTVDLPRMRPAHVPAMDRADGLGRWPESMVLIADLPAPELRCAVEVCVGNDDDDETGETAVAEVRAWYPEGGPIPVEVLENPWYSGAIRRAIEARMRGSEIDIEEKRAAARRELLRGRAEKGI